jgi:hypothetical protein
VITFTGTPAITEAERRSHVSHAMSLGLGGISPGSGRLAIVGSSHSLPVYEETLRRWDGDIWAVNGGWQWCRAHEIPASFFSVHPTDSILKHLDGIGPNDKAILAHQTCPRVLDAAVSSGANVRLYDDQEYPGIASAPQAAYQAILAGYSEVTFFGCDLNFSEGKQHVNHEVGFRALMTVQAAGDLYMTTPAYYTQAIELVRMIEAYPTIFRERSSGLLRAMVEGPHSVAWISPEAQVPSTVSSGLDFITLDLLQVA